MHDATSPHTRPDEITARPDVVGPWGERDRQREGAARPMAATMAYNPRLASFTELVRRRLLHRTGDVLVRVGDRVNADDVVAREMVPGRLRVLDVAKALGVSPGGVAQHLRVQEGQTITMGMELASVHRLRLRVGRLLSPFEGLVVGIREGLLFVRQDPYPRDLLAYVPGEVLEVFPHRGVSIGTTGALVSGIWGSGPDHQGVLVLPVDDPQAPLTWQQVSVRYRGTVLVGGTLQDPRVLYRARQFRVHGIVAGSMNPALRPACERLGLTVIITEGMGQIPMAEPVFELLRSLHGHTALVGGASVNGGPYAVPDATAGPEVIIPQPRFDQVPIHEAPRALAVGMVVRLTRPPYVGTVARVEAIPSTPQLTAVGIPAMGAMVRMPDGQRLFVPLTNLEIL
jgi:hypothetical protein